MDRVVICMKWGTLYGPDYVNVLYSACREYITGDFRFVCLTDDTTGIREDVDTFPIPDMGLSDFDWKKGGWPKLSVFAKDLYGLAGRALFVDLDTVLCGPIDLVGKGWWGIAPHLGRGPVPWMRDYWSRHGGSL